MKLVWVGLVAALSSWGVLTAELEPSERTWRLALASALGLWGALAVLSRDVQARLRRWSPGELAWIGAAWVLACTALATPVDPYLWVIVAVGAAAAIVGGESGWLAVWVLLWIPFDLRWYKGLGFTTHGYALAAPLITGVAGLAFACAQDRDGLTLGGERGGGRWVLAAAVCMGGIVLPLGLGTGFLEWHAGRAGAAGVALHALVIALTVALPEEVFFRGILDRRLKERWGPWSALLVSSLAFGLMHWNNARSLNDQLLYTGLATIAGAAYALAYRRTGSLWAPVAVHTATDVVWKQFL